MVPLGEQLIFYACVAFIGWIVFTVLWSERKAKKEVKRIREEAEKASKRDLVKEIEEGKANLLELLPEENKPPVVIVEAPQPNPVPFTWVKTVR